MDSAGIPRDLLNKLIQFDADADEIARSFVQTLESQDVPSVVYHYTNDAGLRGILENGRLWLSDIFSLNDPSELRHGFSHAVNILNQKAERSSPDTKLFAKHFANFLKNGMEGTAHYFVCSFSKDGDDLGQWRAYADNGRGYALGFDGKALEKAYTQEKGIPIKNNSTHHVTYADAVLEDIHRRMIEAMFRLIAPPQLNKLKVATKNAYRSRLSVILSVHALRAALFFKHEAYNNETEFRFLQLHAADAPPPDVKRRYRAYELVKYREFDWRSVDPKTLKQIVVGPAADRTKATRFANECLAAFNPAGAKVTLSAIPYRTV